MKDFNDKVKYLSQDDALRDIAESLRVLCGRTPLKESRLRDKLPSLYRELKMASDEKAYKQIEQKITKINNELGELN